MTIEADIIKQKLPENNGGYNAFAGYGKTSKLVYDELTTDHPIDLCRWQVANCYMGRIGLINSGGESKGAGDLAAAVRTAVINKRAGGQGLISGRKAFQRPMGEGVELLQAIQDVYLDAGRHHRLTGSPRRPLARRHGAARPARAGHPGRRHSRARCPASRPGGVYVPVQVNQRVYRRSRSAQTSRGSPTRTTTSPQTPMTTRGGGAR